MTARADTAVMTTSTAVIANPATREVRMLVTLLASCDPCGYVDAGGSPNLYAGVAGDALTVLHAGAGLIDLVMAMPPEADASAAWRFANAALSWWASKREVTARAMKVLSVA